MKIKVKKKTKSERLVSTNSSKCYLGQSMIGFSVVFLILGFQVNLTCIKNWEGWLANRLEMIW